MGRLVRYNNIILHIYSYTIIDPDYIMLLNYDLLWLKFKSSSSFIVISNIYSWYIIGGRK